MRYGWLHSYVLQGVSHINRLVQERQNSSAVSCSHKWVMGVFHEYEHSDQAISDRMSQKYAHGHVLWCFVMVWCSLGYFTWTRTSNDFPSATNSTLNINLLYEMHQIKNINISHIVLQLSLPNLLKPHVKSRMKMCSAYRWCSNYIWVTIKFIVY